MLSRRSLPRDAFEYSDPTGLWFDGESKSNALRNAQLKMLRDNRRKYGEGLPKTWGAFVLEGDWR